MNILQCFNIDECLLIAETDEIYKKYAGLKHSNESILSLAKLRLLNAELFLKNYVEPLDLFLSVVENFADSSTKDLELKLQDIRTKKIVSKYKFNNKNINWNTWRQFNNNEKDCQKRKKVFDEFIEKTKYISAIIYNRFEKIRSLYSTIQQSTCSNTSIGSHHLDPLSGYLMNEKITYTKFINFVKYMGNNSSKPFKQSLQNISTEILKRNAEYYDDFYFFRNRAYKDFDKTFKKINPVKEVKKILKILNFDLNRIDFDIENRENKYPSPICFFVGITDYKLLDKLESRNNFMELFFVTFYSANALMKSSFWKNHLSIEASNLLYSKLVKDFTGIEIPGAYWMLHHILPESIMYVPSYLFAAVRAKELDVHLQNIFGETWWKDKGSGKYLQQIMSPGAEIDLSVFSKLDSHIFLKEILSV